MGIVKFWENALEVLFPESEEDEQIVELKVERVVKDLLTSRLASYGRCGGATDHGCGRLMWRFDYNYHGNAISSVGLYSGVEVCTLCGYCFWNRRIWQQGLENQFRALREISAEYEEEEVDCDSGDYGLKEEKGTWIQGGSRARRLDFAEQEELLKNLSMSTDAPLIDPEMLMMLSHHGDTVYGDRDLIRGINEGLKMGEAVPTEVLKVLPPGARTNWLKNKIRAELLARIANCQWLTAAELIQNGTGTRNEFRNLQRARAIEVYRAQLDYEEACYADGWLPDPVVFECYPEPLKRERLKRFDRAKHDPQYRLWKPANST